LTNKYQLAKIRHSLIYLFGFHETSIGRESFERKGGAVMNVKRIAAKGCFLLVIMMMLAPLAGAEDIILKDLYLQNGSVMRCDSVWKGLGNFVWCNQGGERERLS
jgi:hypothetical protein